MKEEISDHLVINFFFCFSPRSPRTTIHLLTIMRFDRYIPTERLRPFVKQFAVSEQETEHEYKVLPSTGLVIGFQYRGQLATFVKDEPVKLETAGISGMADRYKSFRNTAGTGTVLIYFTETGFTHFCSHPANALFNLSISLTEIFDKQAVHQAEEKLSLATNDKQRIRVVEHFLLQHLKHIDRDRLIVEAVQLIYQSKGTIRIKELQEKLFISQSPFEKRFRRLVGTTPKKFASVIRFNAVLDDLHHSRSLIDICYENNFFDQAHFIKDFKQFTGETPEQFRQDK